MVGIVWTTLVAAALAACFNAPERVEIRGWTADAMEPFVSRDGRLLFFNSSNASPRQTDIYLARRVDALHFTLLGPVPGANSPSLDGVASLARSGEFALISPRDHDRVHATVWIGRWTGETVVALQPQPALTPAGPGGFNMDAEISADGQRLYFTDNRWNPAGPPTSSTFRLARPGKGGWRVDAAADGWFARLNDAHALQYAAGLSEDELELFFTRAPLTGGRPSAPGLWVATRPEATAPFSTPERLTGVKGYVEGPSVAPDASLYFHRLEAGRFVIMRSPRACPGASTH